MMNKEMQTFEKKFSLMSAKMKWEAIKQEIKRLTKKFSKNTATENRLLISSLSEEITEMENEHANLNEQEINLLEEKKRMLHDALEVNIHSVMFRSKCKWYEEGEKCSKYFFALEKSKYNAKTCLTLLKEDNSITNNPLEIMDMQHDYYQSLYTSDSNVVFVMNSAPPVTVSEQERSKQSESFSEKEIATAVKQLKNNKCPGPDGIPADFYKVFWKFLKQHVLDLILEIYTSETLHKSASRGILNLIPKKGKDTRLLKNLRPITLLNTDYKIIEKVLVNRIMPSLENIINDDQKGFMPGRHITNNIRKIFDILKSAEINDIPAIILQIDFTKAFDRVEMCAIKGSLRYFGFSEEIIKWFDILYKDFSVKIQNNGNFSKPISIQRSVHQGAPASAAIFVCIAEILANCIRDDDEVRGVFIRDIEKVLNQYADDTDMSLDAHTDASFQRVLTHLENFQKITGCVVNYDKTTVYRIGSLQSSCAKFYSETELNWTEKDINVLGIEVSNDINTCTEANYQKVISKAKATMKCWKDRSLSLIGKVLLINSLISSLFVYPMSVLPCMSDKNINEMEKVFEEFIWNGHKPKIPLSVLKLPKNRGGLSLVDLRNKDLSLKIAWVAKIFEDQDAENSALDFICGENIGNLLWRCNLAAEDIPNAPGIKKIDKFWMDVLASWCKFHFVKEAKCDHILWLNSLIRVDNSVVLYQKPLERGLLRVSQLVKNGKFISAKLAQERYALDIMQYNALLSAIPRDVRDAVKAGITSECDSIAELVLKKSKVRWIYRELLQNENVDAISRKCLLWEKDMGELMSVSDFCQKCIRINITSNVAKMRSFQYRLLHRAIITNAHLYRWKKRENNLCSFCGISKEDYVHLFVNCQEVSNIWSEVRKIMYTYSNELSFETNDILFDSVHNNPGDVSNVICQITKQYIYAQRCLKKPLNIEELKSRIAKVKSIEKYVASKNNKLFKHNAKWRTICNANLN